MEIKDETGKLRVIWSSNSAPMKIDISNGYKTSKYIHDYNSNVSFNCKSTNGKRLNFCLNKNSSILHI